MARNITLPDGRSVSLSNHGRAFGADPYDFASDEYQLVKFRLDGQQHVLSLYTDWDKRPDSELRATILAELESVRKRAESAAARTVGEESTLPKFESQSTDVVAQTAGGMAWFIGMHAGGLFGSAVGIVKSIRSGDWKDVLNESSRYSKVWAENGQKVGETYPKEFFKRFFGV